MIEWRTLVLNLVEESPFHWLLFDRRRWFAGGGFLLLAVLGVGSGWLIAEASPLIVAILAAGVIYVIWV